MKQLFEDAGHLGRVGVFFVAAVIAFLLVQRAVVPKDFGVYGPFRAGALNDVRAHAVHYAGQAACQECHVDQVAARKAGKHQGVSCEACHGALAKHAGDFSIKPVKPDSAVLCARCHEAIAGKPKGFPQVDTKEHSMGVECKACHDPHQPKPKA